MIPQISVCPVRAQTTLRSFLRQVAVLLAAVATTLLVGSATAAQNGEAAAPVKSATVRGLGPLYYMMVFRPGPDWIKGKPYTQQALLPHGRYLQSLYAQKKIVLAGPFTDDAGGFIILDCSSGAEAKAIADNEPATRSGIFISEIRSVRYAFDRAVGRSVWSSRTGDSP